MKIRTRTLGGPTAGFVLSVLFALCLLGVQSVEFWMNSWLPAEGQPAPITLRLPAFSVFRVHLGQPAELVRSQVIIGQGEVVEPNEDARLAAAYEEIRRDSQIGWSLGMFLVTLVACLLLLAELRRAPGGSRLLRTQVTLLALVLVFAAGAKAFLLLTSLPAFYYPMPAVVLLAAFLLGRRIALGLNLFSSIVFASLLGFDLSAMIVLFTTSYAGTLFLRDRKKRRAVIQAGSLSGWFGALALLVLMLVFSGAINVHRELLNPDYSAVLAAVVSGVFSGVVALLLVEPVGWLVGRVSPAKLLELQDLDSPILKQIREEAPGTWEHSRAAANLAEAAAASIGADSLLVRVGAYVHDAGKSLNPAYFIENQTALAITNPHDELEPEVSADCIFDHVREGTALLRKHHMPEAVVEFTYTHHGTSLLEYFWVKIMKAGNPNELKEKDFRYPGMRPRSRETGILMLVDAIEAASRTVKDPSKLKFENLVQRIVFTKLNQGQLDECGLTASELKSITTTLVESLINMYHARIEYPWQQTTTQTGPQVSTTTTGPQPAPADTGSIAVTGSSAPESVTAPQDPVDRRTPTSTPVSAPEAKAEPPSRETPAPTRATPPSGEPAPPAATSAHAEARGQPPAKGTASEPPVLSPPPATTPERAKRRRRSAITLSGIAPVTDDDTVTVPPADDDGRPLGRPGTNPGVGSSTPAAVGPAGDSGSGVE